MPRSPSIHAVLQSSFCEFVSGLVYVRMSVGVRAQPNCRSTFPAAEGLMFLSRRMKNSCHWPDLDAISFHALELVVPLSPSDNNEGDMAG
jgi:hypothetical protein